MRLLETYRPWTAACLLVAQACARPPAVRPPPRPTVYEIAVAAASGERSVTELFRLEAVPVDPEAWSFQTVHSEGSWTEASDTFMFRSDAPAATDPWPLRLQYAIASVPVVVRLDGSGAPSAVEDPERWQSAARSAVYALSLPVEALSAGEQLVDPVGIVADLARYFPGTPPEGKWVRQDRVAGLAAERVETCSQSREGGHSRWQCEGRIEGPTSGAQRLHEVSSWTEILVDRRGLLRMEGGYSGTLVLLVENGEGVLDRPVAGRRLVERQ